MEDAEYYRVLTQRDSMAVYLKHSKACPCCLYRLEKPNGHCVGCVAMDSHWMWGGFKGKPNPNGTKVYENMDKCFKEGTYEE